MSRRVLVVEDDPELRAALAALLEHAGHRVSEAGDVERGTRALAERPPDALLTDYELGDATAAELLERSRYAGPVVCLTGHESPVLPPHVRVLRKPADVDALVETLAAALGDREPPESPASGTVRLAFFHDPRTPAGARAAARLPRVLARFRAEDVELLTIDVSIAGAERHPALAGVPWPIFLPAVCRLSPLPRAWLAGDLADPRPLETLLEIGGARRATDEG